MNRFLAVLLIITLVLGVGVPLSLAEDGNTTSGTEETTGEATETYTGIEGAEFMKNDITAAEMAFLNAIEVNPSGAAMTYTDLGVIRIAQNRYAEAKSAFETAIHNEPQGKTKAAQYLKKLEGMGVV